MLIHSGEVVDASDTRILVPELADRSSHDDSRIVIVLEELGLRQKRSETRGG